MQLYKGQSDIISAILIVVLAIGLLATAYAFGLPLIQKRQDTAVAERVESAFNQNNINSLPSKIESIANNGGEALFNLDVKGVWRLFPCCKNDTQNNSIDFTFVSKVSGVAADREWVSLTPGASCPPTFGVIGQDKTSVVCARADTAGGGNFNVTYKVWFRELSDIEQKNGFKINLLQHAASSATSSGETVRISFDKRREEKIGAKNLIITEIKILLV